MYWVQSAIFTNRGFYANNINVGIEYNHYLAVHWGEISQSKAILHLGCIRTSGLIPSMKIPVTYIAFLT